MSFSTDERNVGTENWESGMKSPLLKISFFLLIIYDTLIMTQEALFIVNNKIVISPMNGSFIIC